MFCFFSRTSQKNSAQILGIAGESPALFRVVGMPVPSLTTVYPFATVYGPTFAYLQRVREPERKGRGRGLGPSARHRRRRGAGGRGPLPCLARRREHRFAFVFGRMRSEPSRPPFPPPPACLAFPRVPSSPSLCPFN